MSNACITSPSATITVIMTPARTGNRRLDKARDGLGTGGGVGASDGTAAISGTTRSR